ncbi:hypothetical protein [Peribacillus frigoritolerans]|uniref:hypothetical protein n=1 Tax=Peribacillus frigoritolerans TaxID=450367 RepID=UPI00381B1D5D
MKRKNSFARCVDHPRIFGATGATGAKGITESIWARGKRQEKRGATGSTGSVIQNLDHLQCGRSFTDDHPFELM